MALLYSLASFFSQEKPIFVYFGTNAGLDFNGGSPVALTNRQLNTREVVLFF
jgi:hypothetical protein